MTDFLTIENTADLEKFCDQIKGSDWLAVDTEFERERTFYPELCLLQVANKEIAVVIDPFSIEDMEPLFDVLYDQKIVKVFHSARQDLEIFFKLKKAIPTPLFDTQVAAPLLGYNEQIGYGNLVKQSLGVELSKAHTRTDWKRRPLKPAQLQYAVDDVIYLGQIYELLIQKLNELGRSNWLDDDFSALNDPTLYEPDPENVWLKIKNVNRLKGKKLAVIQSLAAWRERTARKENRPKNWVMRDDGLFDLSQLLPQNEKELSLIKGIHERVLKRHGSVLLKIVSQAQNNTPVPVPEFSKKISLSNQQEVMMDMMMAIIRLKANEHHLNPMILAPKKELEKFILNRENSSLMKGWREHLIGHDLCDFMDGKKTIQMIDQQLSFVSV